MRDHLTPVDNGRNKRRPRRLRCPRTAGHPQRLRSPSVSTKTAPLCTPLVHDCVHRIEVERQVAPRDLNIPVLIDQSRLLHGKVRLVLGALTILIVVFISWVFVVVIIVFSTLVVFPFGLLNDAGVFKFVSSPEPTPGLGLRTGASPYAARRPRP